MGQHDCTNHHIACIEIGRTFIKPVNLAVFLQVVLTKLSKSLDKDSVRVDGTGRASITEVSFQEISITGQPIHS